MDYRVRETGRFPKLQGTGTRRRTFSLGKQSQRMHFLEVEWWVRTYYERNRLEIPLPLSTCTPMKYPFLNLLFGSSPKSHITCARPLPFQGPEGDLNAGHFHPFFFLSPLQFCLPYLSSGTAGRSAWAARRRSSSCWSPRSTSCIRDRGSATASRLKLTQVGCKCTTNYE